MSTFNDGIFNYKILQNYTVIVTGPVGFLNGIYTISQVVQFDAFTYNVVGIAPSAFLNNYNTQMTVLSFTGPLTDYNDNGIQPAIGTNAFNGSNIFRISFNFVQSIGNDAFANMNVNEIFFNGSAPVIGEGTPFDGTTTTINYDSSQGGWPISSDLLGGTITLVDINPSPSGGAIDCFGESTEILCKIHDQELYVPVQELQKGTLVKTSKDGYISLEHITKATIYNPSHMHRHKNRLYKYSKEQFEDLTQDLYLTGCHSVLVDNLHNSQRNAVTKILGDIYVTDEKYRLPSCVFNKAEPHTIAGKYDIYHITLQSDDAEKNYGIYANGLLVESCCKKNLVESTMEILE
jgi:hypothetical protein